MPSKTRHRARCGHPLILCGLLLACTHCNNFQGGVPIDKSKADDCRDIPAFVPSTLPGWAPVSFYEANKFLFLGTDAELTPVQPGVEPKTLQPDQMAVLGGWVRDRDGRPLPCVQVSVLNHPEYKSTRTRADGRFDMAVNGDATLTVHYEREGFLPAQREVTARSLDHTLLPDVVLLRWRKEDAKPVALNELAAPHLVRGAVERDHTGTRQARLLFLPGTTAELIPSDPDTPPRPIETLHVQLLEITVGATGQSAMPGSLPPASGYTYAVHFLVSEAVAKDVVGVRFPRRPVVAYVDNFLNFPVGVVVPSGAYAFHRGQWEGSDNGRVVKILRIADGQAELCIDGSDKPAGAAALKQLGVEPDELHALAAEFAPGQTLWRVPVRHFTPWDFNWPIGPPKNMLTPPDVAPTTEDEKNNGVCVNRAEARIPFENGWIDCQRQVIHYELPLDESDKELRLVHRNDRVPSWLKNAILNIQMRGERLTSQDGDDLYKELKRVRVEVDVGGVRLYSEDFSAEKLKANLLVPNNDNWRWDGLNFAGQPTFSGCAHVKVTYYYYDGVRMATEDDWSQAWDRFPSEAMLDLSKVRVTAEELFTATREFSVELNVSSGEAQGIGGWPLRIHHRFMPHPGTLFRGDGEILPASAFAPFVTQRFAGRGADYPGYYPPLASGSDTPLREPSGLAPAGNADKLAVFVADGGNCVVRRVDTGKVELYAGSAPGMAGPDCGQPGNGTPDRRAAVFGRPEAIALAADGNLYLASPNIGRIGVASAINHQLYIFAGNGLSMDSGRTGNNPKTYALQQPSALAVTDKLRPGWQTLLVAERAGSRLLVIHFKPKSGEPNPDRWEYQVETGLDKLLIQPEGLALSADAKTLWVSESGRHDIVQVDLSKGSTAAWAVARRFGTGNPSFSDGEGRANRASFKGPTALALSKGELAVHRRHRELRGAAYLQPRREGARHPDHRRDSREEGHGLHARAQGPARGRGRAGETAGPGRDRRHRADRGHREPPALSSAAPGHREQRRRVLDPQPGPDPVLHLHARQSGADPEPGRPARRIRAPVHT
jgi:hypothetical protein